MSIEQISLAPGEFVKCIRISDVKGFFSKMIEIPIGLRVLAFEDKRSIGEIPPGQYTLETFASKLRFWTQKDTVLYLFQSTSITAAYQSQKLLTKENLIVSGEFSINFRIDDMGLFVKNLLGAKDSYTQNELINDTSLIMLDSIQESVAQFSIQELNSQEARKYLEASIEQTTRSSLGRYGINFERLSILSLVHEEYDKLQEKSRQLWIIREGQSISLEAAEIQNAIRLDEIKTKEKINELDLLAEQVGLDREEGNLAVLRRKLELQEKNRQIIQSDKFNEIASRNEMEQFLFENDKNGLIRQKEREDLLRTFDEEKQSSELKRRSMLDLLNQQIKNDFADYCREYEYGLKLKTLEQENEIAKRTETEANRKWLVEIEREKAERKVNLDKLLDQKEEEKLLNDIAFERLQAEKRNKTLQSEILATEEMSRLELLKQKELWELEIRKQKSDTQLDRLAQIQKLNQAQDMFDLELHERKIKFESEQRMNERALEQKFELDKQRLDIERLRGASSFGPDGILAYLNADQAKAYSEVRSSNTIKETSDALLAQERMNSSKVENLMREFLASKDREADRLERNADRMVQMHINSPQVPMTFVSGNGVPQQIMSNMGNTAEPRKLLCPQCRAEVSETAKFCPNCGAKL